MAWHDDAAEMLARLFRLLNDPNRLRLVLAVGKRRKSVSELMSETGLSQTLVSFHLRPLRESGLLLAEREGAFVYYSLAESALFDLLVSLSGVSPKKIPRGQREIVFPPMRFMRAWMKGGS